MKFSDLGLGPDVLRAVEDAGYTEPTPIQEQAIPVVLMGRDILGCAQTGTGKTASFTLPMIEILAAGRARARMPRSLILEPTRELAAQVAASFEVYGKYHKLTTALLIGGESFTDQKRKLDRGVDVLIATPGRFLDLFEQGKVLLTDVKILVIDESDRMLDMGFIPDVERIASLLPRIRQTLFFSATMPPEIGRLADEFLTNAKEISVTPPASPAETVDHSLVVVATGQKREALRSLLAAEDVTSALVFCNRKRDIGSLVQDLNRHGLGAVALHGDMPQPVRTETLAAFKHGEITLLIASDVAARGLDIRGLSHVFNYDVPHNPEHYVHRIGRTGRAGRRGRAFTLATPADDEFVAAIAKLIHRPIDRIAAPGLEAVGAEEVAAPGAERRGRGRRGRRGAKAGERGARPGKARPEAAKPRPASAEPAAKKRGGARAETERPEKAKAQPERPRAARGKGRRPSGRPEGSKEPAGGGTGLGDHIPAFLLRPIPCKGDKDS
jgi:superfamily II DNA/RNA helicase